MKLGFEIYIQGDLSLEEKIAAIKYANLFISATTGDSRFRYLGDTGGGYTSGLWRRRYGISIEENLVFRRISSTSRKFGIVRANTLETFNDKFLDKAHVNYRDVLSNGPIPKMCICPRHQGSIRVKMKEIPLNLYAKVGEVKG